MDESYYEDTYIEFHYHNYTARAASSMTAFDILVSTGRIIHIIAELTYRIREETRLYKLRPETRLRKIAEETRYYKIKEH